MVKKDFWAVKNNDPKVKNNNTELKESKKPKVLPGLGGMWTKDLRPSQKTKVATNIKMPGIKKATRQPNHSFTKGIKSTAKKHPKLIIK